MVVCERQAIYTEMRHFLHAFSEPTSIESLHLSDMWYLIPRECGHTQLSRLNTRTQLMCDVRVHGASFVLMCQLFFVTGFACMFPSLGPVFLRLHSLKPVRISHPVDPWSSET